MACLATPCTSRASGREASGGHTSLQLASPPSRRLGRYGPGPLSGGPATHVLGRGAAGPPSAAWRDPPTRRRAAAARASAFGPALAPGSASSSSRLAHGHAASPGLRSHPIDLPPSAGAAGSCRAPPPVICAFRPPLVPARSARRVRLPPLNVILCGARIPDEKRIECSLTYIYGVGRTTAAAILKETGVENKRTYDLTAEDLQKLRAEVELYEHGDALKRHVKANIEFLKEIRCYRGIRHILGLPVRGQRTRSNARTAKKQRPIMLEEEELERKKKRKGKGKK